MARGSFYSLVLLALTQLALSQAKMDRQEKRQVEHWISGNALNRYGDEYGTMYAGASPLFNEMTGQRVERYDYIESRHPTKPWRDEHYRFPLHWGVPPYDEEEVDEQMVDLPDDYGKGSHVIYEWVSDHLRTDSHEVTHDHHKHSASLEEVREERIDYNRKFGMDHVDKSEL